MGPLLRWTGRGLLAVYVVFLIVVLGLRYWLMPNIDQWRAPISQALSTLTQSEITIGSIQAQWQGIYPELQLEHVTVGDPDSLQAIAIPRLIARFKPSSLWHAQPHFSYLRIDGLELSLQRDARNQWHLAGQSWATSTNSTSSSGFWHWLTQQDHIELQHAVLRWHDLGRATEPIQLSQVQGVLHQYEGVLQYELTATPPEHLGQQVQLQGALQREELLNQQLSGNVYIRMADLSAHAWQQWVDLPTGLTQAQLDSQIWLQIDQSQIEEVALDLRVHKPKWNTKELGTLSAEQVRIFAQGPWRSFNHFIQERPLYERLQEDAFSLEVYASGAQWHDSSFFTQPWYFDRLELVASHSAQPKSPSIELSHFFVQNADFELAMKGSVALHDSDWSQSELDLTARAQRIQLNRLYAYFPTPAIAETVVGWLRDGLASGQASEAVLRWQGRLDQYPYTDPAQGLFYVGAAIEDAVVDYYPAQGSEKGWPKVENIQGSLSILGNRLDLKQAQGALKPNGKDVVLAPAITLAIDDFSAQEPLLTIETTTHGPAQAYLGLMTHSDLGVLLDHTFDQAKATGEWAVPLALRVNLAHGEQTQVQGHIDFKQNTLQLWPQLPPLSQVQGKLLFSEKDAQAQLKAQWLGGPVQISQTIGKANQALELEGQLKLEELTAFYKIKPLALYAQGTAPYHAQIGFDADNQFAIHVQTPLKGIALHLPVPLKKRAEQEWPLQLSWSAQQSNRALHAQLGSDLHLHLQQSASDSIQFDRGYFTWKRAQPNSMRPGFWVDIEETELDLNAWQEVVSSFTQALSNKTTPSSLELNTVRIKTNQAAIFDGVLNQLTYTSQQLQPRQWRTDISSEQVAGTVQWQEDSEGHIQGPVQADFQRIHWQPTSDATLTATNKERLDPEMVWPDLNLKVSELSYGAWHLGQVEVQGRSSANDPFLWQIPHLKLSTPYGELHGQGSWHLAGTERGLQLQTELNSSTMGELLDYVGFKNLMVEGQGQLNTQLNWQQFPWQTSLQTLQATMDLSLQRGRLHQLHSQTGKWLEFLSLQSISRLTTLGTDLRGVLQNGLPFDAITGQIRLDNAIAQTHDFQVVGPVGAVALEGSADLDAKQLDLYALVVPRMEMSGAALAAGFALNPVVGASAFLTQWLLKDPLAKAMTMRYHLTGPWDQVETNEAPLTEH